MFINYYLLFSNMGIIFCNNSIPDYTKQLEKIGKSGLTEEIQKRVMTLTTNMSDQLAQETRIQSSPEELDIKRYVAQVIQEVKEKNRKF